MYTYIYTHMYYYFKFERSLTGCKLFGFKRRRPRLSRVSDRCGSACAEAVHLTSQLARNKPRAAAHGLVAPR